MAPVAAGAPGAARDSARCHRGVVQRDQRGQRRAAGGVGGVDAPGPRVRAADPQVAAAVDDEAGEAGQGARDVVRGQALGQAAGVQFHAGWALDALGGEVRADVPPAGVGMGGGRAGRQRRGVRRPRGQRIARAVVPGALQRAQERRVDQAPAELAGVGDGAGEREEGGGGGDARARVGVEPRELGAGLEAGQAVVPVAQPALGLVQRGLGGALVRREDGHVDRVPEDLDAALPPAHRQDWLVVAPDMPSDWEEVLEESSVPYELSVPYSSYVCEEVPDWAVVVVVLAGAAIGDGGGHVGAVTCCHLESDGLARKR